MQAISASNVSAVSWGAVLAGAAAASAISLILFILGFGLGLSVISPWSEDNDSATAIGVSTFLWIAFTQLIASGLGGYLVGRLRVKWIDINTDEVFFRDTAHGLITWSVSTLIAAAVFTSGFGALLGGAKAGAQMAGEAAKTVGGAAVAAAPALSDESSSYFIDSLLRNPANTARGEGPDDNARKELTIVLFRNLLDGDLNAEDRQYAAQVVAEYTGISQAEAENRVTRTLERARQAATDAKNKALEAVETARKAAAHSALWMFVAMLIGAFIASLLATIGGRQRDYL
jgi:hypothetical protein